MYLTMEVIEAGVIILDKCSTSKIDQFNLMCFRVNEYVLILDIAMYNTKLMAFGNGLKHLCKQLLGLVFVKENLLPEVIEHVYSDNALHNEHVEVADLIRVVQADDV